ncbi:MAG: FtsX-like permease family protein, partial [Gemmatimonadales bacterium]
LALVITGLGVFGVVTGSVAQRRRELGIRLALGANGGRLARLVLLEVAAALVVGLGAGLAISWTGSRLATSLVYGITAADLPSYLGACLVLVAAGVVACVGPVRRVLAIDATESIRVDG